MKHVIRYSGLALLLAGALKVWSHMTAETGITLTSCLDEPFTLAVANGSQGHCWGCYAMGAGAILLFVSVVSSHKRALAEVADA